MKKFGMGPSYQKDLTASQQKGFTIVELLIVIAILAILGTAIYAFFNSISVKSTAQRTVSTTQQQARSALDMMVRDIRMLGLDPLSTGKAGMWPNNNGGSDSMSDIARSNPLGVNHMAFSADLNYDGDVDDPYERIAYYIDESGDLTMETFVLSSGADESSDRDAAVSRAYLVMLTGLQSGDLEFRYFDSKGIEISSPNDAAANNAQKLSAVEVKLTVRAGSLGGEIDRTYTTMVRLRNQ